MIQYSFIYRWIVNLWLINLAALLDIWAKQKSYWTSHKKGSNSALINTDPKHLGNSRAIFLASLRRTISKYNHWKISHIIRPGWVDNENDRSSRA